MSKKIVATNFPYNPILKCMQTGMHIVYGDEEE